MVLFTFFTQTKCKNQALELSKGQYDCCFKLSPDSIVEISWWKAKIIKFYKTTHYELQKIGNMFRCIFKWLGVAQDNNSSEDHWSITERNCTLMYCNCLLLFDTSVAWIYKQVQLK